ncbi:hypothetical protein HYH02_010972 [Chlamydomonas schloesseri]|uniref:Ammonium transporter AmtB-like domain-containing protein n=1 Tax=Chlamydomonas schloesseri TaxID=2026947 RepID=A0A835TDC3_9CHLO|nr:hypothetical protein HYH02_010972 [Chlamydomonas schloesseri]|eukprot:KAG2438274.1 hypothetical protein HYH02_010972 [Chlamydomonas schloesseri]
MPPASSLGSELKSHDWSHFGLPQRDVTLRTGFVPSVAVLALAFIGLFFGVTQYCELGGNAMEQVGLYYKYLVDVNVMVWIGFGFLMTFMRRYGYGAVALNYFASTLMFLAAIPMLGATQQVFWNERHSKIQIDMALLIDCAFCAASGMIAFGAIIGKATPTQLTWLLFFQVPLYALNQHLVIHTFKALDMGGTIVIHLFGAYYGLAASLMISRNQPLHGLDNPKNTGAYLNDLFSMIGTIFLFIYWPSFNGALAAVSAGDLADASDAAKAAQFLCIVNTLLSLLGAGLAVFATSAAVGGRFNMVHIQNSTLAGGVAMGAACTLSLTPGGALVVGCAAGVISTLGYQYITPLLDRTIRLGDTCGVHNLHGIPAVVGTLVAGLAALGQEPDFLNYSTGRQQLGYQVLAGVVTMGIAIAGGLLAGAFVAWFNPRGDDPMSAVELFDDGPWWEHQHTEPLPIAASIHAANLSAHGKMGGGCSSQQQQQHRASMGQLVINTAHAHTHDGGYPHAGTGTPAGTVFITCTSAAAGTAAAACLNDDPNTPARRTQSHTSQAAALGLQQLHQRGVRQQQQQQQQQQHGYRHSLEQANVVVGMNAAAAYTAPGHVVEIN